MGRVLKKKDKKNLMIQTFIWIFLNFNWVYTYVYKTFLGKVLQENKSSKLNVAPLNKNEGNYYCKYDFVLTVRNLDK